MFHIKTDIRQYKCESEEKVILLIRNWVIRPTDQIYDAQKDAWEEIGTHPSFEDIFGSIEQEETNEPDTIVTEAPSAIAQEFEVSPGAEYLPEESEKREDLQPDQHAPPQAPEGVEGVIRDSDEITMMTHKTLDLLREEAKEADERDDSEAELQPNALEPAEANNANPPQPDDDTSPDPLGRHGLPEEVFITDEIQREDVHGALLDELGALNSSLVEEDEELDAEPDEVTTLIEREELLGEAETEESPEDSAPDPAPSDAAPQSDPEEEAQASADPANPDAEQAAPDEQEEPEATAKERARWRISMDEDSAAEEDETPADEDSEAPDGADEESSEEAPEEAPDEGSPEAQTPPTEEVEQAEQAAAQIAEDELDAMLSEAAALVGLDPEKLRADISGPQSAIDAGEDEPAPEEESAPEDAESEDQAEEPGAPSEDAKPERPRTQKPALFASSGQKIKLPFEIGPSPDALRMGLKRSRLSYDAKDEVFPYPRPHKPGRIERREFDLTPAKARSYSLYIAAGCALCLLVLAVAAFTLLG